MKKIISLTTIALLLVLSLVGCSKEKASTPFEAGSDKTEYTVEGWDGYNSYDVYVKIASGDDVIYNGTVTLSSNDMFVSEATFAAITEKGVSSDGVQSGFINSIGDYVNGNDADGNYMYWGYTINGKYVPFACNEMRVLEGDYILWEFQKYVE